MTGDTGDDENKSRNLEKNYETQDFAGRTTKLAEAQLSAFILPPSSFSSPHIRLARLVGRSHAEQEVHQVARAERARTGK